VHKERVVCEVGARSWLLQERLTGEDAECSSEVATVLCVESDGISSFPTPSNKSHHRVTNIHYNILKFLNFDKYSNCLRKVVFWNGSLLDVSGRHCKDKYSSRQWLRSLNYWWKRSFFVQNVCSYFLDTVVQFSIITVVMLHLGRFISMAFRPGSLEIQGSANGLYEFRELSLW
jgi:hypothetical protein